MPRLSWDRNKDRKYATGTDHGILFLRNPDGTYSKGVVWNGLTAVSINPSGGEPTAFWADNAKYLNLLSAEELSLTIEAYSYPRSFKPCLGRRELIDGVTVTQQKRQMFGFCFRSLIGNAEEGNDYSYEIHIIYGCTASPSEKTYSTINDSPEAVTLSWEVSTLPEVVEGFKPTAHFVFSGPRYKDTGLMNVLRAIEDLLYGLDDDVYVLDSDGENILDSEGEPVKSFASEPHLPSLQEIQEVYNSEAFAAASDDTMILDSSGSKIRTFVPN